MAERPKATPTREGNLDEVGAVLAAIRCLTERAGSLDEESTRAVYSLSCMALTEWRLLDEAAEVIGGGG